MAEPKTISPKAVLAEIFMEQCIGTYSGHMSDIPNNPTLKGICEAAMGLRDVQSSGTGIRLKFKTMLHEMAENLTDEKDLGF